MLTFMQKWLCELNARELDLNQNAWQPHYFVEYKAISKMFAVINHQYFNIHNTKKKAENILRSCSFLSLKIIVYFSILSVNYKMSCSAATLNMHSNDAASHFFMKVIKMCANLLTCFHYILNPPPPPLIVSDLNLDIRG